MTDDLDCDMNDDIDGDMNDDIDGDISRSDVRRHLAAWFARQLPEADVVGIDGLDRVDVGHSAEMMSLTVVSQRDGAEHRRDVVVRLRPREPGLLEPYDLQRQFDILRALEPTRVRAPCALWMEPSPDVLGRPFFVMERAPGEVYEREVPEGLGPERVRRMTEGFVDELAEIHLVDLNATGLGRLGSGRDYLGRELRRWEADMRRVQRGPLPGLEHLLSELRHRQPEPCPRITLVHGDAKPGNFAFVDDQVSAVFDWELTDVGDPLADVAYAEVLWALPVGLTSRPGAISAGELVSRYEERTGIAVRNREWYRALQAFKLAVIMLLGSMLFDAGHSDDLRLFEMSYGIPLMTSAGLHDLGVSGVSEAGPIAPRWERVRAVRAGAGRPGAPGASKGAR
jgi:aminoglycoside phosphotransferase (APT) family kinase protein